MKFRFFLFTCLYSFIGFGQQTQNQVVNNGGESLTQNNIVLDFSLGQLINTSVTNGTTTLSQGFLQNAKAAQEVNLSVSANTGSEAGATIITVTASADATVSGDQTVDIGVSGTGITSTDYTLSGNSITILDGQTTGTVTLTVKDDTDIEGTETATLTISNSSSGITLGSTISQDIVITDNDGVSETDKLITTWQTTTANESITIPTKSGETYNYTVDWGDGSTPTNETGDATHAYTTTGVHTIKISGICYE